MCHSAYFPRAAGAPARRLHVGDQIVKEQFADAHPRPVGGSAAGWRSGLPHLLLEPVAALGQFVVRLFHALAIPPASRSIFLVCADFSRYCRAYSGSSCRCAVLLRQGLLPQVAGLIEQVVSVRAEADQLGVDVPQFAPQLGVLAFGDQLGPGVIRFANRSIHLAAAVVQGARRVVMRGFGFLQHAIGCCDLRIEP